MKKLLAALLVCALLTAVSGNNASATLDEIPKVLSLPKSNQLLM